MLIHCFGRGTVPVSEHTSQRCQPLAESTDLMLIRRPFSFMPFRQKPVVWLASLTDWLPYTRAKAVFYSARVYRILFLDAFNGAISQRGFASGQYTVKARFSHCSYCILYSGKPSSRLYFLQWNALRAYADGRSCPTQPFPFEHNAAETHRVWKGLDLTCLKFKCTTLGSAEPKMQQKQVKQPINCHLHYSI